MPEEPKPSPQPNPAPAPNPTPAPNPAPQPNPQPNPTPNPTQEPKKDDTNVLGPKKEGDKQQTPASQAPEKYEFKLPEGANAEALKEWEPTFRDLKLSQADAQKLVDKFALGEQSLVKAQVAALEKQNSEWVGELRKTWGSDFDKHVGFANKGIDGLGIKGLREFLADAGLNNAPLLAFAFAKVGAEFFSEAQPSTGRTDNGEKKPEKSTGELMYPQMKSNPDGRYKTAAA